MFKRLLAASAALMGASAFAATAASAPASTASATAVAVTATEVGLLAGIAGFVAGWAVMILVVLALFGIIAEANDARGWSVFWMIIAAAVVYVSFNISLMMLAIGLVGYIIIGLFWSFWRYKRHAAKVVQENRDASSMQKERVLAQLHPKAMLGTITAWIMVWPFSMVENLVGDLITGIQMLVTKFFRGVYHRVYDAAVAALQ